MRVKNALNGSMTVEMSLLAPILLFLFMNCMWAVFYFHDKNILAGAAYETVIVGSAKARMPDGTDEGELTSLFHERADGKCILFAESSVSVVIEEDEITVEADAKKGKLCVSVKKSAAVTDPEGHIRDIRRIEGIINGAKNYD